MTDIVAKLDDFGRPAWIALMVAGFIVFWPLGLGILIYLIWSGRMGCGRMDWQSHWQRKWERKREQWERQAERFGNFGPDGAGGYGFKSTGNRAFDDYRAATLKRLEEEFGEFRAFLDRLRDAKDKAEFEQFMADRRNPQPPSTPGNG